MNFAKNLLGKYGWKEGDGLGRNNDGINAALKPNYKFDKGGLGHNKADDMNNHWWENVFNNAANNMEVSQNAAGVVSMECKSGKSIEITTKNYSINDKTDTYYKGAFLKTSTLINASQEVRDGKDDDEEVVFETVKMNPFKVVADEDLLKACNGRTAHKGARHGIKMSGKLARIEAQERELMAKMNLANYAVADVVKVVADEAILADDWVKVKKRKHSKKDKTSGMSEPESVLVEAIESTLFQNDYATSSKKKDKKKRRTDTELANALAAISTKDNPSSESEAVSTKKSKSKRDKNASETPTEKSQKRRHCDDTTVAEISSNDADHVHKKSKKSKKRNQLENEEPSVEASDFLKTPEEDVVLSTKQNEKLERKRLRQVKRLAKNVDSGMQIDE